MTKAGKAWLTIVDQADLWLARAASIVLGMMMLFIFGGAISRYAFNAPIAGGNEIIEMASVAVVMLGVAYCTKRDAHVRIDLLDPILGRRGRAFGNALYQFLGTIVLAFLVKAYIFRTWEAWQYQDHSNMIGIPLWPFYGLIIAGMGMYCAILIAQLARQIWLIGQSK